MGTLTSKRNDKVFILNVWLFYMVWFFFLNSLSMFFTESSTTWESGIAWETYRGHRTPHTHQPPTTPRMWTPHPAQLQSQQLQCPSMSAPVMWCHLCEYMNLIVSHPTSSHASCIFSHGWDSLLSPKSRKWDVHCPWILLLREGRQILSLDVSEAGKRDTFSCKNREKLCLFAATLTNRTEKVIYCEVKLLMCSLNFKYLFKGVTVSCIWSRKGFIRIILEWNLSLNSDTILSATNRAFLKPFTPHPTTEWTLL